MAALGDSAAGQPGCVTLDTKGTHQGVVSEFIVTQAYGRRPALAQLRGVITTPSLVRAVRAASGVVKCTPWMPSAAAPATFSGRSSRKITSGGRAPSVARTVR